MTIQTNEIKILDQILLVDLSAIHLWTARKKLKAEMLEGKIPPADLASLGSMRVIDPERLKPFEKIKRQAIKAVEECGVKFLGGYAVSQDKIQEVVDHLEALKTQFYDLKSNFLPNYDRWVSDWVNQGWEKVEWREAIRSSATPKAEVDAGLQFGYAACRVAPDGDKHLSSTLGGQVRGLADQLFAETADTAERLLETGLATRGHVTQNTLNTVRKMNAKLKGLMFLSSDVKGLSDHIEATLAALPTSGVVNGVQYGAVVTLISSLSTEESIKRLIKHLNIANGSDEVVAPAVEVQLPTEPAAPQEPVVEAVEAVEQAVEAPASPDAPVSEPVMAEIVPHASVAVDETVRTPAEVTESPVAVSPEPAPEPEVAKPAEETEPEPLPQAAGFWF
ncbi:DUF3150 domain-containing protein [Azotobacter chroococcum]|uniref:DUF3150 domain-containing protein n=1 Tax=Azotobacter chroococcum TaxID=353 RepID=UPI00103CC1E8|nr:DUF3150 domain-containing protein [Azotobacter chroococcum]TBW34667.1 DUF3150 domain-containing protein [Azotobacter chroococcum]